MWMRASQEASTFKGLEASWLDPCLETMFSKTWNCNFLEKNASFAAVTLTYAEYLATSPCRKSLFSLQVFQTCKGKAILCNCFSHKVVTGFFLEQSRTRKSYYRFRSFRRSARDVFPKLAAQVRHLDQIGIRGWLGEITELKSKPTPFVTWFRWLWTCAAKLRLLRDEGYKGLWNWNGWEGC